MAGPPLPASGRQRSFSADTRSVHSLNDLSASCLGKQRVHASDPASVAFSSEEPFLGSCSDIGEDPWETCDQFSESEPAYISFHSRVCASGKGVSTVCSLPQGQDGPGSPLSPSLSRSVAWTVGKSAVDCSRARESADASDGSGGSTTPTGAYSSDFSRASSPACEASKAGLRTYAFDAYPSRVFSQWEGKNRAGESCGLVPTGTDQWTVSSSAALSPEERHSPASLPQPPASRRRPPHRSDSSTTQSVHATPQCDPALSEDKELPRLHEASAANQDRTKASAGRRTDETFRPDDSTPHVNSSDQFESTGKNSFAPAGGQVRQQKYTERFGPTVTSDNVHARAPRALIEYEAKDPDSVLVIKHETGSLRVTPCPSSSPVCFGWPGGAGAGQASESSRPGGGPEKSRGTSACHLPEAASRGATAECNAISSTFREARPAGVPSGIADQLNRNHPGTSSNERPRECHPTRPRQRRDIRAVDPQSGVSHPVLSSVLASPALSTSAGCAHREQEPQRVFPPHSSPPPEDASRTVLQGSLDLSARGEEVFTNPVASSSGPDEGTSPQPFGCAREFGADINNTKLFQKLLRSELPSPPAKEALQKQVPGAFCKNTSAKAAKARPVPSRFRSEATPSFGGRTTGARSSGVDASLLPVSCNSSIFSRDDSATGKPRLKRHTEVMGQQDRVFLRDLEARRRQLRLRAENAASDLGMTTKSTRASLPGASKHCSLALPSAQGGGTCPSAGVPRDFVGSASNVQLPKWMRDYGVQDPSLATGNSHYFPGADERGPIRGAAGQPCPVSAPFLGGEQEGICDAAQCCGASSLGNVQRVPAADAGTLPFLRSEGECLRTRHASPNCWAGGNCLPSANLVTPGVPRVRGGVPVVAGFAPAGPPGFPEGCSSVSFPVTHFVCSNCGASADPPYCPTCGAVIVQLEPPEDVAAGRLVSRSCRTELGHVGGGMRGRAMRRGSPLVPRSCAGRGGGEDQDMKTVSYAPYDLSLSGRSSRNPSSSSRAARDTAGGTAAFACSSRKGNGEKNSSGGDVRASSSAKTHKGQKAYDRASSAGGSVSAKHLGAEVWSCPRICALFCSFLKLPQLLVVRRCSKNLLVAAQFEMRFVLYATLQRLLLEEEEKDKGKSSSARAKSCSPVLEESPRDRTAVGDATSKKKKFSPGSSRREQSLPACPFNAATLRRLLQLSAEEVKKLKAGKLPDRRAADARSPRAEDMRNRAMKLRRGHDQGTVTHGTPAGVKSARRPPGSKQAQALDIDGGDDEEGGEGRKNGKDEEAWRQGPKSLQRAAEGSDFSMLERASETHIRREIQFQREQELLLKERQLEEQERNLLQKEQILLLQQSQQLLQERALWEQLKRSAAGGRSASSTFGYAGVLRGRPVGRNSEGEAGGILPGVRGRQRGAGEEGVSQPVHDFESEPPTFRRLRHSFLKLWNYNEKQLKSALYRYAFSSFPAYCFDTAAILCRCIYQLCANATSPLPLNAILLLLSDRQSYLWRRMGRLSGYLVCSLAPPCASSLPAGTYNIRSRACTGSVQRLVPLRLSETAAFLSQAPKKTKERYSGTQVSSNGERLEAGLSCDEDACCLGDTSIRAAVLESIELKLAKLSPEFIDEFVLYGRQQAVLMQLQAPESGGAADRSLLASSLRKLRKQPQDRYVLMDLYEWLAAALTFVQRQSRLRTDSCLPAEAPAARGRTPVKRTEGGRSASSSSRPVPLARSLSRKCGGCEEDEGRMRRGDATPGFGGRRSENVPGRRRNVSGGRSTSRAGGRPCPLGGAEGRPVSQVVHGYTASSRGRVHQDVMFARKSSPIAPRQGMDSSSGARSRSLRGTRTAEVQRAVLGGATGRCTRFGVQPGQEANVWTPTKRSARVALSPARPNGLTAKEAAALCKLLQSQGQILEEVKQILRQISKPG